MSQIPHARLGDTYETKVVVVEVVVVEGMLMVLVEVVLIVLVWIFKNEEQKGVALLSLRMLTIEATGVQ